MTLSVYTYRRKTIWLQHLPPCFCAEGDFIPTLNDTFWPKTVPMSTLREELHAARGT